MKKLLYKIILFFVILVIFRSVSFSQSLSIGDPFENYIRLLITDENANKLPSFNIRPIYVGEYPKRNISDLIHPWNNHSFFNLQKDKSSSKVQLFEPVLKTTFNSHLPVGQNDGALWQGKGLNTQFSGGISSSYGPLSISLRPLFVFSQNLKFNLSKFIPQDFISKYGSPRSYSGTIDRPQRFGEKSVSRFYPGQSWIRLEYQGLATGVSSENIWSGPAQENPIIFSNNGPGFAHIFVGTYKPVETVIGNFEGRLLGGRLYESDYFDTNPINDKRFLNAIILNYSPSIIPGLHVGGTRMIQKYYPGNGPSVSDFFEVFQPFLKKNFVSEKNPSGNIGTHQLISLFARWVFPAYGMEVYTEWSRNDHSADVRDLLRHFEHARAYILGLTKKFELSNSNWLTTNIEVTQLEVPRLQEFRNTSSYYSNGEIVQGFTNRGQILGAGIGPGSNNQRIQLNYYHPKGLWGVSLNRIAHNNDRLYKLYERHFLDRNPSELHNIEFRLGIHGIKFIKTHYIEIQADLYWSHFLNYDYQYKNDQDNLNLQICVRYSLPRLIR